MFLVLITYKKSLDEIDRYLIGHHDFLDAGYKNNYFIVSGPKNPRTGGIIISQLGNREQLEQILNSDPFKTHDAADYEIIEFMPVKYHRNFSNCIEKN